MNRPHLPKLATLLLLALLALPANAEEMALSAENQLPLLLKVLTYDRNLEQKAGKELAIGIVHDPSDRDSAKATDEIATTLQVRGQDREKAADQVLHDRVHEPSR